MISYTLRTFVLLAAIAIAGAADSAKLGSVVLIYAGSEKTETFAPTEGPFEKDLGMLKGRDQFSVGWSAASGTYGKPNFRMLTLAATAPKDGSAIQGMVLSDDRSTGFALYQPRCVLNTQDDCDIKTRGVDLDIRERTIRFTDARFLRHGNVAGFPEHVVINGVLHF